MDVGAEGDVLGFEDADECHDWRIRIARLDCCIVEDSSSKLLDEMIFFMSYVRPAVVSRHGNVTSVVGLGHG